MNSSTIDTLDLNLSWKRFKADRPNRAFYTHPLIIDWIELDLVGWFASVRKRLAAEYAPQTSQLCFVPKPRWLVRPGALLNEQDELVLNAIVGTIYGNAYDLLGAFQGDPDVANQLQRNENGTEWVKRGFRVTEEWRNRSVQRLKTSQFVVFTDLVGFYENIDLNRLASDLKPLCPNTELLQLLMSLLHKWAHPRGKGIPQGFSASDILAKIYLHPVDCALRHAGFVHLRYVDDIRIVCKTRLEAKRALLLLNEVIRKRGLNLQSAKSNIVRSDQASNEIDGVKPLIEAIQLNLAIELREELSGTSSVTLTELEHIFKKHPSSLKPEVLEQAFHEHFGALEPTFNKTLFHFLLTRLGKTGSRIAIDYAIETLQLRPDETDYCLRYLDEIGPDEIIQKRIIDYISSSEAIYDYQIFQILVWFAKQQSLPVELLPLCRVWSADKNRDLWLRTSARAIVGREGDQSDLEAIEGSYDTRLGDIECADIVEALTRMELGRRNSFYGRINCDSDLVTRAIRRVRADTNIVAKRKRL